MNAIQHALMKLDSSIGKLEDALLHVDQKAKAQPQIDQVQLDQLSMFNDDTVVVLDREEIKDKLDKAIEQVETILKQA